MNKLNIHYAPVDTNTLVFYPYPWGGSDYNTRDRLNVAAHHQIIVADDTRYWFDIATSHLPGTGRMIIDKASRRSLKNPNLASDLLRHHVETLADDESLTAYENVIAAGVSGRSWQVARMALSTLTDGMPQIFTHVMTADGVNAAAPHSPLQGLRHLVRNASRHETDFTVRRTMRRNPFEAARALGRKLGEVWSLGSIMCRTTETQEALRDLAYQTKLPYHSFLFEHGISGSLEEVQHFSGGLMAIHDQAVAESGGQGAPFAATIEPLGHGDLMNPAVTIRQAAATLALTDQCLAAGFTVSEQR